MGEFEKIDPESILLPLLMAILADHLFQDMSIYHETAWLSVFDFDVTPPRAGTRFSINVPGILHDFDSRLKQETSNSMFF